MTFLLQKLSDHKEDNLKQNNVKKNSRNQGRVLLFHTGGTIGMSKNENGMYVPQSKKLEKILNSYPYFFDQNFSLNKNDGYKYTPQVFKGRRVAYKYSQKQYLIDSTNLTLNYVNDIVKIIKQNYDSYDGFVIFHGTDTLSFCASALSFAIQNLHKTVVLTGAQIPIGQVRNDSINNALCSLVLAAHYLIPEVVIVFNNRILRGNRSKKIAGCLLNAFDSPNLSPLGTFNFQISFRKDLILPESTRQTQFHFFTQTVSLIKLNPFDFHRMTNTKLIVVESYGVGNIPTQGSFYEWALSNYQKKNQQKSVVVNVSQVLKSLVINSYATGEMAQKLGFIPGSDMTCQAALAKLSYLASRYGSYSQKIKQEIPKNICGELTHQSNRQMLQYQPYFNPISFINNLRIHQRTASEINVIRNLLPIVALSSDLSNFNIIKLIQLHSYVKNIDSNGRNCLHNYFQVDWQNLDQNYYLLQTLLNSIDDNSKLDYKECSPIFYALQKNKFKEANIIKNKNGLLIVGTKVFFNLIRKGRCFLIKTLLQNGLKLTQLDLQRRNCFMYACINNQLKIVEMLYPYFKERLFEQDIYGKTSEQYWKQMQMI